jgi:hypothetical protein
LVALPPETEAELYRNEQQRYNQQAAEELEIQRHPFRDQESQGQVVIVTVQQRPGVAELAKGPCHQNQPQVQAAV